LIKLHAYCIRIFAEEFGTISNSSEILESSIESLHFSKMQVRGGRGKRGGRGRGRPFGLWNDDDSKRNSAPSKPLKHIIKKPLKDARDVLNLLNCFIDEKDSGSSSFDENLSILINFAEGEERISEICIICASQIQRQLNIVKEFLLFLTGYLSKSVLYHCSRKIYEIVLRNVFFFDQIFKHALSDSCSAQKEFFGLVCQLILLLKSRLPGVNDDEILKSFIVKLVEIRKKTHFAQNSKPDNQMIATFDNCLEIFNMHPKLDRSLKNEQLEDSSSPISRNIDPKDVLFTQGPGDLHSLGPRHDNDNREFRRIQNIPTEKEIECLETDFLPKFGFPYLSADPSTARLEFNYRLLREECFSSTKTAIQYTLSGDVFSKLNAQGYRNTSSKIPRVLVYSNLRFKKCYIQLRKGLLFEVAVHIPRKMKKEEDLLKVLNIGSLVVVCIGIKNTNVQDEKEENDLDEYPRRAELGADRIYFATIMEAPVYGENEKSKLVLKFNSSNVNFDLAKNFDVFNKLRNSILQVKGTLFETFDPILRSLQNMERIPFGNALL
jgi:hypothetical protein